MEIAHKKFNRVDLLTITGRMDAATTSALRRWQSSVGYAQSSTARTGTNPFAVIPDVAIAPAGQR